MSKRKVQLTIKTKVMSMVMLAIIIPLACLIFFSKFYYKAIIEQKRQDQVEVQAQYAANIAAERISSAIKLSKDITYERGVEQYARLLEQKKINETTAYYSITKTLKNKFYLNKKIVFSAVLLECNPEQIYSITADGRFRINDYLAYIDPKVQSVVKGLGSRVTFIVHEQTVYIVRNLISTDNFKKYGVIINEIETTEFFKEFLSNTSWQHYIQITLGEGSVQLGTDWEGVALLEQDKMLHFTSSVEEEDFILKYEVKMSKQGLVAEEIGFITGISIGIIILLILLSSLLYWFYRSIIGPIEQLTGAFKTIENGELGVVVPHERQDELGFLIKGFNEMSKKTKYLIEYVYKEELALKEAKIKALQSQINPHFINNTLEIINWKAQMIGAKEISKMIRALGVIMNASSSRNNAKMVPLKEEIIYMDSYLYILERRFEERIHIVKSIDEKVLECQVPLLLIQPLLENAVVHGIEPAKGGELVIAISEQNDVVHIVIGNNGQALDEETALYLKRLLSGEEVPGKQHSVGIRNVNERIKLIYGEGFGLEIVTNSGGMTESRVTIPFNCTNNSNKSQSSLVK
jgi:two-component system sensor histidine kinase YesM